MSTQLSLPRRTALITAAVMTLGALMTTYALAQTPTPVPVETPSAQTTQQASVRKVRRALLVRAAAALKMTPRELIAEMRAGKSVADVAQARSVPLNVVREAVLAPHKVRLDKAVTDGRITRAQADERLAKLSARIDNLMTRKRPANSTR